MAGLLISYFRFVEPTFLSTFLNGLLTMRQQLYAKLVIEDETISAPKKNKIVGVFSEMDKRLIDGSEEHLAILDLSLRISGILSGVK